MPLILACYPFSLFGLLVYPWGFLVTVVPRKEDVVMLVTLAGGVWPGAWLLTGGVLHRWYRSNPQSRIFALRWPGRVAQYVWVGMVGAVLLWVILG